MLTKYIIILKSLVPKERIDLQLTFQTLIRDLQRLLTLCVLMEIFGITEDVLVTITDK